MSGPKTSVLAVNFAAYSQYGLTEEAKKNWTEREIITLLESLAEAEKQLQTMIARCETLLDAEHPNPHTAKLLETARALRERLLDDIDEDHDYTAGELSKMRSGGARDVDWHRGKKASAENLQGKYLEYFQSIQGKSLDKKINIARSLAARSVQVKKTLKKLEFSCWDMEESMKDEVFREGVRTSFYIPFRRVSDRSGAEKLIEKINGSLAEVSELFLAKEHLTQLQTLKQKAGEITDASYLSNFYQLVVQPFIKQCRAYDAYYNEHFADFEELRRTYLQLAEQLHTVPQEREFSEEGLAFYQAETERMQAQIFAEQARKYVMQAVNEAMAEMGYDVIGSREIVRRNGKKYQNSLFLYDEGTAVSVMQTPDGQVTMEIGGLDYGDRVPSQAETERMVGQMETFCTDYGKIEELLKARGVEIRHVSLAAPDSQYATIINMEDFSITVPAATIREAMDASAQGAAETKARHVEE